MGSKFTFTKAFFGMLLCLFLWGQKAQASHIVGCDLYYELIDSVNNQYLVTLALYRDCVGIGLGGSQTVSIASATCGVNFTQVLTQLPCDTLTPGGTPCEVSPLCDARVDSSACNGGNLPGIERYEYQDTVSLPGACEDWIFSWNQCCRNAAIDNLVTPGGQSMYCEAWLDNTIGPNNSVQYTTLPVPYICNNQLFRYNHGALDIDGDSIVYQFSTPLGTNSTDLLTFSNGFRADSFINVTAGTNIGLNTASGNITFTPDGTGEFVSKVTVVEYRNGDTIGLTMREMQIFVVSVAGCANAAINFPGIDTSAGNVITLDDSLQVTTCANDTVKFTVPASADSIYLFSNNLATIIPTASFDTFRVGSDSVYGVFSWFPSAADTGLNCFTITAENRACPLDFTESFSVCVNVIAATGISGDSAYCPAGGEITLAVDGGTSFTWLSATDSVSSNAATGGSGDTLIVAPSSVAPFYVDYIVQSDLPSVCQNRDTFRVYRVPDFTFTAVASPDTICRLLTSQLTISPSSPGEPYTYIWTPADGTLNDETIANPFAAPNISTTYNVTIISDTGCSQDTSLTVVVTGEGPTSFFENDTVTICRGDSTDVEFVPCFDVNFDDKAELGTDTLTAQVDSLVNGAIIDAGSGCGAPAGVDSMIFFTGVGDRILKTPDIDVTNGGEIRFQLVLGNNAIPPCDRIEVGKGIVLEYTTDGGASYTSIDTFEALVYVTWTSFTFNIPAAAQTAATAFRWRQMRPGGTSFGLNFDQWSMAQVEISCCGTSCGSGFTAAWTPNTNIVDSTDVSATVFPTTTTNYTVALSPVSQPICVLNDTVTVRVADNFNVNLFRSEDTICKFGNATLWGTSDSAEGPYGWAWDAASTLSITDDSVTVATPLVTTTYPVTVTSDSGCIRRDSITLNVRGVAPTVESFGGDSNICWGDTATITVLACGAYLEDSVEDGSNSSGFWDFTGISGNASTGYSIDDTCGAQLGTNAIRLNSPANDNRRVYSRKWYVPNGGKITFWFRNGTGGTGCDIPSSAGADDFRFQARFDASPNQTQNWDVTQINGVWTEYTLDLNSSASTADSVQFLWLMGETALNTDVWLLDNITLCLYAEDNTYPVDYSWTPTSFIDDPTNDTVNVYPPVTTTYTVVLSDSTGQCTSTESLTVNLDNTVTVTATPDTTICSTDSLQLFSEIVWDTPSLKDEYYCDTFDINAVAFDTVNLYDIGFPPAGLTAAADYSTGISLPFQMNFFCSTIPSGTSIYIGHNGFIFFDNAFDLTDYGGPGPHVHTNFSETTNGSFTSVYDQNRVAGVWANYTYAFDGTAANDTIIYGITGTAPNRTFAVGFYNMRYSGSTDSTASFQIQINEADSSLEIHYIQVDLPTANGNDKKRSSGVIDYDGTPAYMVTGRDADTTWTTDLTAVAFQQRATGNKQFPDISFQWTPNTGLSSDTAQNPMALVTSQTTYSVVVDDGSCLYNDSLTISISTADTSSVTIDTCEGAVILGVTITNDTLLFDTVDVGGCDSVIYYFVNEDSVSNSVVVDTICQGDSSVFSSNAYYTDTTITDTFVGFNGCDSIVGFTLVVNDTFNNTVNDTICEGDTYVFNATSFNPTADTTITATFNSVDGCDSTETVLLVLRPRNVTGISATICFGDTFRVFSSEYTTTNTYTDTLAGGGANGCDTVVNLNLTVRPENTESISQTICFGDTVFVNGNPYTTTATHRDTLAGGDENGCDSITILTLTVRPENTATINQTICFGDTFFVNGNPYTTTNTFNDTLVGGDVNGCDSITTLNLTVRPENTETLNETICFGDTFFVNGNPYTSSATHRDTLVGGDENGCDSITILNLTVRAENTETLNETICFGDTFFVNGNPYTTTATHRDTLAGGDVNGCDSITILNLTVRAENTETLNETICFGDTFFVNGNPYTTTATHRDTLSGGDVNGCDSITILNLTIRPENSASISQTICFGDTAFVNGNPYTSTATHRDTLVGGDVNGCDSITILTLTVRPENTESISQTICFGDTAFVNGNPYTTTATHRDTLAGGDENGCDSITILNLTVRPENTATTNQTICFGDTFFVNGNPYTTTNTFADTLVGGDVNGCDSITTLNLTVRPENTETLNETICFGDTFFVNGNPYTSSATHRDTLVGGDENGCDSITILNLTVRAENTETLNETICFGDTFFVNGNPYTTTATHRDTLAGGDENGCDSITILNLTVRAENTETLNETICFGDTFFVNGNPYFTTATHRDTLVGGDVNGCDSITILNLTIRPENSNSISQTICFGDTAFVNGNPYTTTATHRDTLVGGDVNGCDSITILALTVRPENTATENQTICFGDTFFVNGNPYTTSGSFADTLVGGDVNGCDSITTLNLTVRANKRDTLVSTVCFGDTAFMFGNPYNASGVYNDTVPGGGLNGCDTSAMLDLTVRAELRDTLTTTICFGDSEDLFGTAYNMTGVYADTQFGTGTNGCDTVAVLDLTVRDEKRDTFVTTICFGDTFTVFGVPHFTTGFSSDTNFGAGADGCDTIAVLDLTVRTQNDTSIVDTICFGDTLFVNGNPYTATSSFADTAVGGDVNGCDSIVNVTLVMLDLRDSITTTICFGDTFRVGSSEYTSAGNYIDTLTGQFSCDSIVVLDLSVDSFFFVSLFPTICPGDTFQNGSSNYTSTGVYRDTFVSSLACDSIVETNLTVFTEPTTSLTDTICFGDTFFVGSSIYTTTGVTSDTLLAQFSCDSIVNLDLFVQPEKRDTLVDTICFGDFTPMFALNYSSSGVYVDTLAGGGLNGCDTIAVLDLFVRPETRTSVTDTVCFGDTSFVNGNPYVASGSYSDTLVGGDQFGCDSIVDLDLFVRPNNVVPVSATICFGDTFFVHGNPYTSSGLFSDTLADGDQFGCDSIVNLTLTRRAENTVAISQTICFGDTVFVNGNPYTTTNVHSDTAFGGDQNGCDSIVNLSLTVRPETRTILNETVCFGDTFFVNGNPYFATASYSDTAVGADQNGCDSIVDLNLTVRAENRVTLADTVCFGDTSFVHGNPYTTSGSFSDTLAGGDANGCDSIVDLDLVVRPNNIVSITDTVCFGDTSFVNGNPYTTSGSFNDTLTGGDQFGCDSITSLDLFVRPENRVTLNEFVCFGDTFFMFGTAYTSTGLYNDTLAGGDVNGCDSIINLTLTIRPQNSAAIPATICFGDTFFVNGNPYTTSGVYADTLVGGDVNGCDSITSLSLNVLDLRDSITQGICFGDTFRVGTSEYTTTGNYIDTLSGTNACDSIVVLDLTVDSFFFTPLTPTICPGDTFEVGSSDYTATGVYRDTFVSSIGCDSIVETDLTVFTEPVTNLTDTVCFGDTSFVGSSAYTVSGNFSDTLVAQFSCDSFVNLALFVRPEKRDTLVNTICFGDTEDMFGTSYNATGVYVDTSFGGGANGCDTIAVLDLTVRAEKRDTLVSTICFGDSEDMFGTSYNATGFYLDTNFGGGADGCDTIAALDLTVRAEKRDTLVSTICFGDSEDMFGTSYSATGFYLDTNFGGGADGCDTIAALDLTVRAEKRDTLNSTICFGDSEDMFGTAYTMAGRYVDTSFAGGADGCDTIAVLNLTVLDLRDSITTGICFGDTFRVGSSEYTTTGNYIDTLSGTNACDSIVVLDLSVDSFFSTFLNPTICPGDTFRVGSSEYTATGNYTDTFVSSISCDSFVFTDLTVFTEPVTNLTDTICFGDAFVVGSSSYTTSGNFSDTLLAQFGCDSFVNLDLTVRPYDTMTVFDTVAFGQTSDLFGTAYGNTGVYTDSGTNVNGCDSVVTLDLFVRALDTTTVFDVVCFGDSSFMLGTGYNATGVYTDTGTNQFGNDSIVMLDLTVRPELRDTLVSTICFGDTEDLFGTAYNATGVYADTSFGTGTNGCDTIAVLDLTVRAEKRDTLVSTVCFGDSEDMFGTAYNMSGVYTDTSFGGGADGCDTIAVLDLTVRAEKRDTLQATVCFGDGEDLFGTNFNITGIFVDTLPGGGADGCDTIAVLDLVVRPQNVTNLNETICFGDTFFVNGNAYNTSGFFSDTAAAGDQFGCDSIVNLTLTVRPEKRDTLVSTICFGDSEDMFGTSYNMTGVYVDTSFGGGANGCDTIAVLDLIVRPENSVPVSATICYGDTFFVHGNPYTTSGAFADTLAGGDANGCDSIVNLTLTVRPENRFAVTDTVCFGDTSFVNGNPYTATGVYSDTLAGGDVNGCDSIVDLTLTVRAETRFAFNTTICFGDTFFVNGNPYTATGVYSDTAVGGDQNGCDSIVDLTLTMLPENTVTLNESICFADTFFVNGNPYTGNGTFRDTAFGADANGCDSIVVLNLTERPNNLETVISNNNCEGDTILVFGNPYFATGTYFDTLAGGDVNGCDTIVELVLTIKPIARTTSNQQICANEPGVQLVPGGQTYTATGVYVDTMATTIAPICDSIITLNLTVLDTMLTVVNRTICQGDSFAVGANWFFTSQNALDVLVGPGANGCDSVVNLTLTVNPAGDVRDTTLNICANQFTNFLGEQFDSNTVSPVQVAYNDPVTGCERFFNVTVNVLPVTTFSIDTTICEGDEIIVGTTPLSDIWGLDTLIGPLLSSVGCDSFVRVTINTVSRPLITSTYPALDSFEVDRDPDAQINVGAFSNGGGNQWSTVRYTRLTDPFTGGFSFVQVDSTSDSFYSVNGFIDTMLFRFYYTNTADTVCPVDSADLVLIPRTIYNLFAIPEAFTPNNDGTNDYLPVYVLDGVEVQQFSVFNRWGQEVYSGSGPDVEVPAGPNSVPGAGNVGWDGFFKGLGQPAGVYVWRMVVRHDDRTKRFTGSVTLLR